MIAPNLYPIPFFIMGISHLCPLFEGMQLGRNTRTGHANMQH